MNELVEKLTGIVPSKKQLEWQKLEFTAFFHYGMNTFSDREWGLGDEDVAQFSPACIDTDDWCESIKSAGIKACIITAKHHDGFCLWDTKYTEHNVMNSPCKKDIVAMLSKSCKKYGLKLGIYLSPWDRHDKSYGFGKAYDDYFCSQLTELLTNYGDIYTVWFDGACGEGSNGKKQIYNWNRYYELINNLQPEAVISVCGPDVRWCGNEAGDCRESEWSVVPCSLIDNEKVHENSQQVDDDAFRTLKLETTDRDLGSRELVKHVNNFVWYPAEVDTSIRPGWFHHSSEDEKVRPLEKLFSIYLKAIGGNSVLLLNIPPHKDGYITEFDKARLRELGDLVSKSFSNNVLPQANLKASSTEGENSIDNVKSDDDCYWKAEDYTENCKLDILFDEEKSIRYITLMEQILLSQRVEAFDIYAQLNNSDKLENIYHGTTVGYKKICDIGKTITAKKFQIHFTESRKCPTLKFLGFYSL